jgi:hypothetical protein
MLGMGSQAPSIAFLISTSGSPFGRQMNQEKSMEATLYEEKIL